MSSVKILACTVLLMAVVGCRTYQEPRVSKSRKETSRVLTSEKFILSEISYSYEGTAKTIVLEPSTEKTFLLSGHTVVENMSHYLAYNPLWELLELPEAAIDFALMPIVLLAGICTGHYSEDLGHRDLWYRTVRPALYKLCPITNDIHTLAGRRKRVNELLGSPKIIPTEPWEKKVVSELSGVKLLSLTVGEENRIPVTIKSSSQKPDGTIELVFTIGGMDPDIPTITDCNFILKLSTPSGVIEMPFQTEFNQFLQTFPEDE